MLCCELFLPGWASVVIHMFPLASEPPYPGIQQKSPPNIFLIKLGDFRGDMFRVLLISMLYLSPKATILFLLVLLESALTGVSKSKPY